MAGGFVFCLIVCYNQPDENMKQSHLKSLFSSLLILTPFIWANPGFATNLSIGADYRLKGVAIEEREKSQPDTDYYDSRLQAYLTTDLSRDVEASIRVQSITPWGLEDSTTPVVSRYPDANGNLWVQNAFIRLPNIWDNKVTVTVGRQPLVWGDGAILSDDELGLNAIRAQVVNPLSEIRWLGPLRSLQFDLEGFAAKINDGLQGDGDADLHGLKLGFDRESVHWEIMGLWENDHQNQMYKMGSSTIPVSVTGIKRQIFGIRGKANLKDAFLRGEYYRQMGDIILGGNTPDTGLKGEAYVIGLGGKANTKKVGRFGAILEIMVGSGDDAGTPGDDETFRPTFASRWDGLERKGMGGYFAATFSDVYSSTNPFANPSSVNDGLPAGMSGIQSIHFGVEATPWAKWTFTFDYYQYKAQRKGETNASAGKELGTEFDYGFIYRYSGLVSVRGATNQFSPGNAFSDDQKQDATLSTIQIDIKF